MAVKKFNNYYLADYIKDLPSITDAKLGSKCHVIENATDYICNSEGIWFDTVGDIAPGYEKELIDLSDYATKDFVKEEIAKVEIPEVNGLATEKFVEEKIAAIKMPEINLDDYLSKDIVKAFYRPIKYEVTNLPAGAVVNYDDREIRVYCPEDVEFIRQNVGENGNANMYYMSFKAYAPEGAAYFKEGDRGVIIDEMFDFKATAAGTDKYDRNYSICWLALASYDNATGVWNYFGKTSTTEKYIGWNYVVEWYDENKKLIGTDGIRINLSNKNCHLSPFPYYGAK